MPRPTQAPSSDAAERLRAARRVVIKLGTSVVAGGETSALRLGPIVDAVARAKQSGRQIVLVSSGAVGLGRRRLALDRERMHDLVLKQACAAVGQSVLMNAYDTLFGAHGITIAQVLLTEDDFRHRSRYFNLRRTMEKLLKLGVVPIVNENDTVSTAELEDSRANERVFSDNDRLAALVMSKLDADALVLLTNVDGVLRSGPDGAEDVIPLVSEITPELRALASGPSADGRGGMLTKLEAAEIALRSGGVAVVANGRRDGVLDRILHGEPEGTVFVSGERLAGKRRWIAYAADVQGKVVVNSGARAALLSGKASLLASGVVKVEIPFEPAEVVSIVDDEGKEFARGIANCGSAEVESGLVGVSDSVKRKTALLVRRDNILLTAK